MKKLSLMLAGLGMCGNVLATDLLSLGGVSHHFQRDLGFNEVNYGLGYERDLTDALSLGAGIYKNSIRRASFYVAVNYHPLDLGHGFRLGVNSGLLSGYRHMAVAPALLPSLEWRGSRLAIQMIYVPTVQPYIEGAIGLQFKYVLGTDFSGIKDK